MPSTPDPSPHPPPVARLVISCPDRPGIVAAVSGALADEGANITQSDQYSTDPEGGTFLMRVEFHIDDPGRERFEAAFAAVAASFDMHWRLWHSGERKRVALLVSRHEHCLLDLLWRWRRGELDCDIPLVVSNHPDLRDEVSMFGVEFVHIPVSPDRKPQAEERLLEAVGEGFDLVVLARYMQILSGSFLDALQAPVINIHHSFLPAFAGADPYTRALQRGVKVIGATAHYVTEDLDEGPIIEQDTARVSHRDTAESLTRVGRDIERTVLARAVKWHLEDRVLVSGTRTVVFA
jgi:formyltetrahydrofolate deformylase